MRIVAKKQKDGKELALMRVVDGRTEVYPGLYTEHEADAAKEIAEILCMEDPGATCLVFVLEGEAKARPGWVRHLP